MEGEEGQRARGLKVQRPLPAFHGRYYVRWPAPAARDAVKEDSQLDTLSHAGNKTKYRDSSNKEGGKRIDIEEVIPTYALLSL